MISFILDHLPWWIIPAVGAAGLVALFVVLRSLGFSMRQTFAAIATLGVAVLVSTIYQKGRRAGVESATKRQRQADDHAERTREEIEDAVAGRNADDNRGKLWVRALPLLFVVLLAGCSVSAGSFCRAAKPIYAAPQDATVISDRLVSSLNAHNETGAKLCGWKP